jgi:HK97 family phage portal protein
VSLRSWLGFAERDESRTITPEALYGDTIPFTYGGVPGVQAPPVSQSRALSLAPVYSAVRVIADPCSTLPIKAYRKMGDRRVAMAKLPVLFDDLVTDGQLVPFLYQCITSLALRGNAYGLIITRDGFGYPTQIIWLDPALVAPDDRPGSRGGWLYRGAPVPREDMLHITRFALAGQRQGLSPVGHFAATIGMGLNAQRYGSDWFDAGGFPPGHFRNEEKTITQPESDAIKARLVAAIRSRTPLVYGRDWTYNPISVPNDEAQFIEAQRLTANHIAGIYGVDPDEIGGQATRNTYANVEQKSQNFTTFTLRTWLVIMETAFNAVLPDRQYIKFNSDALVRADLATRWQVNKLRVEMGAASINEIRTQEDEEPIPGGDEYGPKALPAAPTASQADDSEQDQPGAVTPIRRIQR